MMEGCLENTGPGRNAGFWTTWGVEYGGGGNACTGSLILRLSNVPVVGACIVVDWRAGGH